MELDITDFFHNAEPFNFSASVMEMGKDAGRITWANAKETAADAPLLTSEAQLDAARDYFAGFGAWSREEIAAWDATEVNALLIQEISGNLRELESLCMRDDGELDWTHIEALSREGTISGNIYPGDDGRIYFYMSS